MSKLKELLKGIDDGSAALDELEVYADSVKQALALAADTLQVEISDLDYEILAKGTKGFMGFGREPYKLVVRPLHSSHELSELDELDNKITKIEDMELKREIMRNADSEFKVRVTKRGVFLTVTQPRGTGKLVDASDINNRCFSMRIAAADARVIEREANNPSGKSVKIAEWSPNPEFDSSMTVEVTENEMAAIVHFTAPRFAGRHMEMDEVLDALRAVGVVSGINESRITKYLDDMNYSQPLYAAEGISPKHGRDAYVDYKVRVDKNNINYKEVEGQVDFKDLDLIENVVVGQLLAVKIPAEKGMVGRSIMNRVMPARPGRDTQIKFGKGTILSDDGMELTAEINGQVVYNAGKISVEPIFLVKGDVDLSTGNIVFLGSVVVTGNVQDNFQVKAAGNIEVRGNVQKAFLEAEGDVIVRQGINGRDEGRIESTNGTVYAKFVQRAIIVAEKDVIIGEELLHSHVDAGRTVLCNGRRAQIVGGVIRAGDEVNARIIGAESYARTEIRVGMNPKVLQQMTELQNILDTSKVDMEKLDKDIQTLNSQKLVAGSRFAPDKEEHLVRLLSQKEKMNERTADVSLELEELRAYLSVIDQKGRVCAEKTIHPGVEIYIKDQKRALKDALDHVKVTLEGNDWRFSSYEPPGGEVAEKNVATVRRR